MINQKEKIVSNQEQSTKKTRISLGQANTLIPFKLSIIINIIIFLVVGILQPFLQPVVPLFYSLSQNSDQIVSKAALFLLPAISLLINIVHIGIINWFKVHQLIAKLFAWADFILQVILLAVTIRNILVIF